MGILVSGEEYRKRMDACTGCKHLTKVGSCGPLIVGATIKYKKGTKHLCGCMMAAKNRFKYSSCPIHKFETTPLTPKDKALMKNTKKFLKDIEGKNSLSSTEVHELYSYHNITHGSKEKSSGCAPCVKSTLKDLQAWASNF